MDHHHVLVLWLLFLLLPPTTALINKHEQSKKITPDDTLGGITPASACHRPNSHIPRNAGKPLGLPPSVDSVCYFQQNAATARKDRFLCKKMSPSSTSLKKPDHESYVAPSSVHGMFPILNNEYFVASVAVQWPN